MPFCQVTLSANAGVAIRLGRTRLWVDALHAHHVPGFSTLSPELRAAAAAHPDFSSPDLLFFTHCHSDHFSQALTEQALRLWPRAALALPEAVFAGQLLLSLERESLALPDLTVRFARLPHEGRKYADVPHYGCVAECDGFRVLVAGDCAVASPALAEFLAETGPVDLALLDFPWITLRRGREFIRDCIRPRHLWALHLPFAEDDCFGYRPAAEKAAALVEVPDVRLLWDPLQRETIDQIP